jgi:very-short-patch-repair endonuclease
MSPPFPIEDFLASVTAALKVRGDARSTAVLLEAECEFGWEASDFGVDYWSLRMGIPIHIFHALEHDEVPGIENAILDVGKTFFSSRASDSLSAVKVAPTVVPAPPHWRKEALAFVKGEGITNQGRVRSDNIASKQHRGLLFRSEAEVTLFQAMTRARLAVAPLPVFVRIGKSYHRLEPDFVVVYKGLTFVVEVDGDTFHKESPADADKRLIPLTHEGVEVRRIKATDVATDSLADTAVQDLVQFMARRKEAR